VVLGLQIHVDEVDRKVILRIEGRVDAASASVLEKRLQQLIDEHRRVLLLDFSRVDYLSSAGMRVLLAATKKLKAQKGQILLFSLDQEVFEIVRMAGLDRVLHICANEKEALQSVQ
jgi:anti-sigma B factor antagonist/stage II sporulation protein AA (anti-sigma F factor antagonist)